MTERNRRDAGQAFPIYIVMVAGLLFLAFAFFAVGQASATRNGAQGAADAAALAAAQEVRRDMGVPLLQALREPNGLNEFLAMYEPFQGGRGEAMQLAFDNRSEVTDFRWQTGYWQDKVTTRIKTHYTVGESVIPGTEKKHATATATAVIKFRCDTKVRGLPDPAAGGDDGDDKGGTADLPILTLDCGGLNVPIDLGDSDLAAGLGKLLFDVQLIDD
ncbi:pilus assembly protein TadG-related protein [Streptomyces sp. NBC_01220]|uniref:pilus assembly protein TadG-related protein n=1 Tax=Streptomyces sp. NBC_01220 TaxID=2903781 RepID=UPI00352F80AD|nr:pilus assembly protein TadG-related protein [Streptomyces sp. NBC_01220]